MKKNLTTATSSFLILLIMILTFAHCSGTSIRMDAEKDRWKPRLNIPEEERDGYKVYGSSPAQQLEKAKSQMAYSSFDDALKILDKIISGNKKTIYSDEAYYLKGKIYSHLLNHKRNYDLAIAAFKLVIDNIPDSDFDIKAEKEIENIRKILQIQKK
ncbi:tol-pal system YbgF family protein [candidate division KSB1 bacterium]